jgi:site-specific DNA-methyltransferase (adenine-specific)
MGGYRQEKQMMLIPARFAIAMQEDRWILRNDLIWSKPHVAPRPERDRLRLAHEHFLHFVKRPREGRAKYFYDLDQAEPGARDVVSVATKAGSDGHSATFPEALITPRILTSSPPGGTVLDPFAGTGRTLDVALKHGRNAIGFELSPTFIDVTRTKATSR